MIIYKCEKKWLALLLFVSIVVAPVFAEGRGESAAKKPQIITAFLESGGAGTAVTGAVESFNEKYAPEYKVEVVRVSYQEQLKLTMNELINQVGAYDVIIYANRWFGTSGQFIEDLTPYMEKSGPSWDEFLPGMKALAMDKGKVLGLPFRTGANLMFANEELLAGIKVPETWDEFKAAIEKLAQDTNGDGNNDIFGTDMQLGNPRNVASTISWWFYAHGGEFLIDLNTAYPFDSKHGRLLTEIFTYWKYLFDNDLVPKSVLTDGGYEILQNFQAGRVALSFIYSNRSPHIEDPSKSKVVGKASYNPMPRTSDGWYYVFSWLLSIPNYLSQQRKDAAYKFVSHAFTHEANLKMALEYANGPTIKSVLESKDFKDFFPATAGVKKVAPYQRPEILALLPNRAEVEAKMFEEVHAFMTGRKTPKDAAQAIFSSVEKIVKK